jgi:hypothetical protein
MIGGMSLAPCRHCGYEPVASDAKRCPRCGGFNPNPSIIGSAIRAVATVIFALVFALFAVIDCGGGFAFFGR